MIVKLAIAAFFLAGACVSNAAAQAQCREPLSDDQAELNLYLTCVVAAQREEIELIRKMLSDMGAAVIRNGERLSNANDTISALQLELSRMGDRIEIIESRVGIR